MDRRHSIKLIIAAAVGPVFIAKGLMPVKPTQAFDDFIRSLKNDPSLRNIRPLLPPPLPQSFFQVAKEWESAIEEMKEGYNFLKGEAYERRFTIVGGLK